MGENYKAGLSFFAKYLSLWVAFCIAAIAVSLFGMSSGAALATVVGVLVEVPVMLSLVGIARATRGKFSATKPAQ